MPQESVKDFYNRQYSFHEERKLVCPNALHDLAKAHRRVAGVLRGLDVRCAAGATVLDVGSGLGYYTKALAAKGAAVTGIDFSEAAIDAARVRFPELRFTQAEWPTDIPVGPQFDLIWMVNFSLMNTFDVGFIDTQLVEEAVRRLKRHGHLVIGWNTNFSGETIGGYCNWPMSMVARMMKSSSLTAPFVAELPSKWVTAIAMRAAYFSGRSMPIFMARRND